MLFKCRADSSWSKAVAQVGWLVPLILAVPSLAFGNANGTGTGGTDSAEAGGTGGTDSAEASGFLEMGVEAACSSDWAEACVSTCNRQNGGWVLPRTLADMVLTIEADAEGGAESKPHMLWNQNGDKATPPPPPPDFCRWVLVFCNAWW